MRCPVWGVGRTSTGHLSSLYACDARFISRWSSALIVTSRWSSDTVIYHQKHSFLKWRYNTHTHHGQVVWRKGLKFKNDWWWNLRRKVREQNKLWHFDKGLWRHLELFALCMIRPSITIYDLCLFYVNVVSILSQITFLKYKWRMFYIVQYIAIIWMQMTWS